MKQKKRTKVKDVTAYFFAMRTNKSTDNPKLKILFAEIVDHLRQACIKK
jgi:hypothetical protein